MAIVCAVGDNLRLDSRIAARVVGTLDGFAIRMVSQAASRRNVTIVLRDADVPTAMTRLHQEFFGTTAGPAVRPSEGPAAPAEASPKAGRAGVVEKVSRP